MFRQTFFQWGWLVLCALLILCNPLQGQEEELVTIDDLNFNSRAEKSVFTRIYQEEAVDWLEVFVYATSTSNKGVYMEIKQEFDQALEQMESRYKLSKKKPAKKVNLVYEYVNDNLLSQYQMQNEFCEVFGTGKFNCVSGTALYALLFDQLQLHAVIQEQPNHVFLIVLPQSEAIVVESTNRFSGISYYDQQDVALFVENLVQYKYEDEEALQTESYSDLFERYFFKDKSITIRELAGIQYGNIGNYHYRKENYEEAVRYYQKAWFLYPHFRFEIMLYDCWAQMIKPDRYSSGNTQFLDYLISYCNKGPEYRLEYLEYVYTNLANKLTIEENHMEELDTISVRLLAELQDSNLVDAVTFYYYLFKSGYELEDLRANEETERMIREAYRLRPESKYAQDLTVELVVHLITQAHDADSAQAILQRSHQDFPHLKKSTRFNVLEAGVMLFSALESFRYGKGSKGELYLNRFEEEFPNEIKQKLGGELIDEVYGEAASYYFKRGQKSKARQVLEKGLEYNPNSYELKSRLRMVNY